MRGPKRGVVTEPEEGLAGAMEAARALGRALRDSTVFKRFEAVNEAFQADIASRRKLRDFQFRRHELKMSAMSGGADRFQPEELEREWETTSSLPSLRDYLRAEDDLTTLLREVARKISEEIGVDYGAACSPSRGCC